MVDIAALLSDQPIVDDGGDDSADEGFETSAEGGSDYDSGGEAPDAQDSGEAPEPQRQKKVPIQALHEERTKRQEREAELQRERDNNAKITERLTKILEAQQANQQQAQQPPPQEVPNFVDDPEAAFNHVQQQLADTQRQMQDYLNGTQQQYQAQQQYTQLTQQVSAQEAQFTSTVPDYPQAADYFYQRKVAEYAAFTGDEYAAKQQVANDYKGIATLAQRLGKNPAELMYNAAKAMGYVPGAPQAGQQRKQAPTSLSNAHGSPRAPDEKGAVSAADIASMSEAEFDKYWSTLKGNSTVKPRI